MTSFPRSPRIRKGGIVLIHPLTMMPLRIIPLQYNPATLSRSLEPQMVGEGNRVNTQRFKAPAIEKYTIEVDIDAADQLEIPEQNQDIVENGLTSTLAVLETILYPSSIQMIANEILTNIGVLEIIPMEAPLILFIWSKNRIMPVQITSFSVDEEAFDTNLNPIRAKVSLGMTVLTVNDLGFISVGGGLYMAYQMQKEAFARKFKSVDLTTLGLNSIF